MKNISLLQEPETSLPRNLSSDLSVMLQIVLSYYRQQFKFVRDLFQKVQPATRLILAAWSYELQHPQYLLKLPTKKIFLAWYRASMDGRPKWSRLAMSTIIQNIILLP